jgi:hypothetical protein
MTTWAYSLKLGSHDNHPLMHTIDVSRLSSRVLDRAYRFRDAPPNGSRIPLTIAPQFRRARLGLPCGALTVLLNHASSSPQNI